VLWHYRAPAGEELAAALAELDRADQDAAMETADA
jgi:hypothetical protein